jgi:hypothetical protein
MRNAGSFSNNGKTGAFGLTALELTDLGLHVVPCRPSGDGKSPRVTGYQKRPVRKVVAQWVRRHSDHNIGIVPGSSGHLVVDVDVPGDDALAKAIEVFGDTPIIVRTPSGGHHLYFKLGNSIGVVPYEHEGLKGELRGNGVQVLVPPSVNPKTSQSYVFIRGSFADLAHLPTYCGPDLKKHKIKQPSIVSSEKPSEAKIQKGDRNNFMFQLACETALSAPSLEELVTQVSLMNERLCHPPMSSDEVAKICKSIWKRRSSGTLRSPGLGPYHPLAKDLFLKFKGQKRGPDALMLYHELWFANWDRDTFVISPEAMRPLFACMGVAKLRKARDLLLRLGLIRRVRAARKVGSKQYEAFQYTFTKPSSQSEENITYTPSRSSPGISSGELCTTATLKTCPNAMPVSTSV